MSVIFIYSSGLNCPTNWVQNILVTTYEPPKSGVCRGEATKPRPNHHKIQTQYNMPTIGGFVKKTPWLSRVLFVGPRRDYMDRSSPRLYRSLIVIPQERDATSTRCFTAATFVLNVFPISTSVCTGSVVNYTTPEIRVWLELIAINLIPSLGWKRSRLTAVCSYTHSPGINTWMSYHDISVDGDGEDSK